MAKKSSQRAKALERAGPGSRCRYGDLQFGRVFDHRRWRQNPPLWLFLTEIKLRYYSKSVDRAIRRVGIALPRIVTL